MEWNFAKREGVSDGGGRCYGDKTRLLFNYEYIVWSQYYAPSTLYPVSCTLYLVPCIPYLVPCISYPVPFILYPVSCTLGPYPVSRILYLVPCILNTTYTIPVSCVTVYPVCLPPVPRGGWSRGHSQNGGVAPAPPAGV